jgi:hypothetical protein
MGARTARVLRTDLPMPTTTATVEADGYGGDIEAVDAIWNAYMACNATGHGHIAWQDGPTSPMSLLARAGKSAIARFPGVSSRDAGLIWEAMCDGASGAQWAYNLWRRGEI